MATYRHQVQYDDLLNLKDAGAVAASAAGSIILDVGDGFMDGYMVLDVTALEVADGNEVYTISLEGSNNAAMASGSVELSRTIMGNAPAPADQDTAVGRFVVPVTNEQNGTLYRYLRINTIVAGTVATGINYSAFLTKRA